ncbi:MAG: PEGA domain-containing protein, partial [Treponema sp.]|nr:PEGA domain-containing protein [Treponema sp.]
MVIFLLMYLFLLPVLDAQTLLDMQLPGDIIGETEGRGLLIRSNPRGAKVYIDGIERGSTPLRLEDLRAGTYNVRLKKDGYGERSFQVNIKSGSVINISLELKASVGRIILRIQPAQDGFNTEAFNPVISVDGQPYAEPALELPVGFRTIRVRAFGWEDFVTTEYIEEDSFKELNIFLNAAPFKISGSGVSRSRFNPVNPGALGAITYNFEVSAPGRAVFTVEDDNGITVYRSYLENFESRQQAVVWDGYDWKGNISGDGIYTLIIKARSYNSPVEEVISAEVTIDSLELIYPLTVSSGKSGLLYAPFPALLPARSFQIEGSLLAGSPPASGNPWKSLPFSAAFRVSPIKKLELAAAVNMVPFFEGGINTGFAGSAKWAFLKSGDMPLGFAGGFVFSWTGKNAITPFG